MQAKTTVSGTHPVFINGEFICLL